MSLSHTIEYDGRLLTSVISEATNAGRTRHGFLLRLLPLNDDDPTVPFSAYDSMPPLLAKLLGFAAHA